MNRSCHDTLKLCFFLGGKYRAFSLIELLTVIAILALLLVTGVLGFQSIVSSHGVSQAATDVATLLEFARDEAVNRQSYMWVGLKEATNNGAVELQMAAVYSVDGTTNTGTNLQPLSRIVRVKQVGLVPFANLSAETRSLLGASTTVTEYATNTKGITFKVGATEFSNSLTFTPRGEAMLNGGPTSFAGFDPQIGVGIVPSRRANGSANDAGVVLDGSTGMARVLRR